MKRINMLAAVILVVAIALGITLGLLIQSDAPRSQIFSFNSFAIRTTEPIQCGSIPQSYTDWLGINVVGNRTGMSFSTVTVYATGLNIRVDIPLNGTAFAELKAYNSTLETIIAPLPNYFDPGTVLTVALTYSISNYAPNTVTLAETPIIEGTLQC